MKYLLISLVLLPSVAFASTDHYFFNNVAPQYTSELTPSNLNQAPFSVSCGIAGGKDNSILWTSYIQYNHIDYTNATPVYGYTIPTQKSLTESWSGDDVSKVNATTDYLNVAYKDSGTKFMTVSVTDGTQTEVKDCGSIYVGIAPIPTVFIHQAHSDISY